LAGSKDSTVEARRQDNDRGRIEAGDQRQDFKSIFSAKREVKHDEVEAVAGLEERPRLLNRCGATDRVAYRVAA
jgi:hypothetical protein